MSKENEDMPESPLTTFVEAAAQIKEMFDSFIEVGFTEEQAIQFTLAILKNSGNVGDNGTS